MDEPKQQTAVLIPENEDVDVEGEEIAFNDERLQKSWDLRVRGMSLKAIASANGVSLSTVRRDLKEMGRRYKREIMESDPVTLVTDHLHWLDEMERIALFEVHSAESKKITQKFPNPQTGEMTEIEIEAADPNKAKFYMAALRAREMKLRILTDTGIIPTGQPEKMFRALEAYETHEEEIANEKRSPEEIKASVARLLAGGRRM